MNRALLVVLFAVTACNADGLPGLGGGDGGLLLVPIDLARPDDGTIVGPHQCVETHDGVTFSAKGYDGKVFSCADLPRGDQSAVEYQGEISAVTSTSFTIDSCGPAADCISMLSTFTVSAPGLPSLDLLLPRGGFVTVQVKVAQPFGCTSQLAVVSLPVWEGTRDPAATVSPTLYLAFSDGVPEPLPDAQILVQPQPLHCKTNAPSCGAIADDFALMFAIDDVGQPVTMGQTVTLDGVSFRNLRSLVSGACDDDFNWGWWAARFRGV